jgi:hypothetical protein
MSSQIVDWMFQQQGEISNTCLSQKTGISCQSIGRARMARQDLTTEPFWRLMVVMAELKPYSDCARVVRIVQGLEPPSDLKCLVANASEKELKEVLQQILARVSFRKK